jgi:hypothetical protein
LRTVFTATSAPLALRPRARGADTSAYAGFAPNPAKQASLGLFHYFDFSVIAMNPEVCQGPIGGLIN